MLCRRGHSVSLARPRVFCETISFFWLVKFFTSSYQTPLSASHPFVHSDGQYFSPLDQYAAAQVAGGRRFYRWRRGAGDELLLYPEVHEGGVSAEPEHPVFTRD